LSKRFFRYSDPEHQKQLGPKVVMEGVLDLALIAGFLAPIAFLITFTIRFVFLP
jgi:hypothetical protein